jgi:predicted O-methyltransferase YrrM
MAQSDPFSMLTQSMRKMASLRIDDITRGLENFANPSARGMLESMGRTRDEQVETMAGMLRNSSEAEIEEMGTVFGMAMAKLAEERSNGDTHAQPGRRRHRTQTAAERRRERRLAS